MAQKKFLVTGATGDTGCPYRKCHPSFNFLYLQLTV